MTKKRSADPEKIKKILKRRGYKSDKKIKTQADS